MPTLTQLIITISGNPRPFFGATQQVRQAYHSLERDMHVASARMAGNLSNLGKSMTVSITAPVIAAATAAGKASIEFEDSLAKIRGLVGETREQVNAWKGDILSLAGEVGKGPQELAEALYFVTSSGIHGAEAMEVLKLSSKAAASGMGEAQKVADALTSVLNAYRGTSLTAAQATDIMVATVREGKAEADKIAGSIGHVAALAAEMGVSFADVGAAIASLTRVGLDSAESVTALKRVLASLLEPTAAARKVAHHFGIDLVEMRKAAGSDLIGTLLKMKEQLHGNAEAAGRIFGSMKGLTGILSLTGGQAQEVQRIFEEMRHTTGDLDKAFAEASDTGGFKMRQAFAEIGAAAISLGDTAAPIIKEVAKYVKDAARAFREMAPEQQRTYVKWVVMAAAIGPVIFAMGQLLRVLKTAYDVMVLARVANTLLALQFGATAAEALRFGSAIRAMIAAQQAGMFWTYAFSTALGSVISTVGIALVALGALYGAYKLVEWAAEQSAKAQDIGEYDKKVAAAAHEESKSAMAKLENTRQLGRLTAAYQGLQAMQATGVDVQAEMKKVMNEIATIVGPDLVKSYDDEGNAIVDLNRITRERIGLLYEQAEAARIATAKEQYLVSQQLATKRANVQERIDKNKQLLRGEVKPAGAFVDPVTGEVHVNMFRKSAGEGGFTKGEKSYAAAQLQEDIKERDRLNKELEEQNKRSKAALNGGIGNGPAIKNGPRGSSGGGSGGGKPPPKDDPTHWNLDDMGMPDKEARRKRDKAAEDGKRLMEEYMSAMQAMRREQYINGETARWAAAEWDVYHGSLSRVAEDGTRLTETQKQQYIEMANMLDEQEAIRKSTELTISSKRALRLETELMGKETELEKADVERLLGKYKELSPEEWNQVRALIALKQAKQEQIKISKEVQDAITAEHKKFDDIGKSIQDYGNNLREQIHMSGAETEVEKLDRMTAAGGRFSRWMQEAEPFFRAMTGIDIKTWLKGLAEGADRAALSLKHATSLKEMKEEIALMGDKSRMQKAMYEVTEGEYRKLDVWQKMARVFAGWKIDQTQKQIDADKAAAEAEANRKKKFDEYQKDIKQKIVELGIVTKEQRIELLMLNDDLNRAQAEAVVELQDTFDRLNKQYERAKGFADDTLKIFEDVFNELAENGFGSFFETVLNGFRQMMRQMFLEWAKSQLYKSLLKFGIQIFGSQGGGGASWGDTSKPDLYPDVGVGTGGGEVATQAQAWDLSALNLRQGTSQLTSGISASTTSTASSTTNVDHRIDRLEKAMASKTSGDSFVFNIHGVKDLPAWRDNKGDLMHQAYNASARMKRKNG